MLTQKWIQMGLLLEPDHSAQRVLGWSIVRNASDRVVLGASSENGLHGELLIRRHRDESLFASLIQYDTEAAHALWSEVEPGHAPVMCKLIDDAASRLRTVPEGSK